MKFFNAVVNADCLLIEMYDQVLVKHINMKATLFTIAMCTLIFSFAHAQEADGDQANLDSYDLSLEELMSVEVESSTKSSVKIQRAPSVIRVYTKKDFDRFNFIDLNDVLNSIPGTQVQQYRAAHQLVWIRGVQARYNNKVLLLIDGVPMRDSYYGNFNIDEMIPIELIEKVEVINGPGSVLYGANSFSGVISVTTKKKGKSVGMDYGSNNSISGNAEYDIDNFYGHVGYYQSDGFEPELKANGVARDIPQNSDNTSAYLKYQSEALTLTLGMMNYNYSYKYRSTDKDYTFKRTPVFGSAKYKLKVGEQGQLNIGGYVNDYSFTRFKTKFIDDTSDDLKEISTNDLDTRILGADIDYSVAVGSHQIIVGTSIQRDQATDLKEVITFDKGDLVNELEQSILDPDIKRDNTGFFIQDLWDLDDSWSLVAGLRYDVQSNFDNQLSYRIGLTTNLSENVYGKLLYGTAYRVPSYREYLDVDAPNALLKPEELQTLELQIGYLFDKGDINLTFYNNSYQDFISEIVVDSIAENGGFREVDDEMAFNFKSRDISGLELNTVLRPDKHWAINFGLSYIIRSKQTFGSLDPSIYTNDYVPTGEVDITFLSNTNLYALLNYKFAEHYTIGFNTTYVGDRNVPSNYQADVPVSVQNASNADGFVKVDFVGSAKLGEHFRLSINVNNLFDSAIYSPPFGGSSDYDAQWQGINFRGALSYRF